jgi:Skp family chaperone for outer membrane proteins
MSRQKARDSLKKGRKTFQKDLRKTFTKAKGKWLQNANMVQNVKLIEKHSIVLDINLNEYLLKSYEH